MKKTYKVIITLLIIVVAAFGALRLMPNPFESQVKSLIDETGANYPLIRCSGGWLERKMYCEVKISPKELPKVVEKLGLDQYLPSYMWREDMPNSEKKKRLILVSTEDPCSSSLRKQYEKEFSQQQWTPSRHGFSSAIFFYNPSTQHGCFFLSIAYG